MTFERHEYNMFTPQRHALWWWLHHRMGWSATQISIMFGVDHSTVSNGKNNALKRYPREIAMLDLACKGDELIELLKNDFTERR